MTFIASALRGKRLYSSYCPSWGWAEVTPDQYAIILVAMEDNPKIYEGRRLAIVVDSAPCPSPSTPTPS